MAPNAGQEKREISKFNFHIGKQAILTPIRNASRLLDRTHLRNETCQQSQLNSKGIKLNREENAEENAVFTPHFLPIGKTPV